MQHRTEIPFGWNSACPLIADTDTEDIPDSGIERQITSTVTLSDVNGAPIVSVAMAMGYGPDQGILKVVVHDGGGQAVELVPSPVGDEVGAAMRYRAAAARVGKRV